MTTIDLTPFVCETNSNNGICKEWAACRYFGIERISHDHTSYDKGSDIELADGRNISVKSSGYSLMSGSKCVGCKTFEGIWRRYYKNCHSNTWLYITKDWQGYLMNKKEFSKFTHLFGRVRRESSSKGGNIKIRCLAENREMLAWLEKKVRKSA